MTTRLLQWVGPLVGLAVLAAACGSGDSRPQVGAELRIFNWDDYFAPTTLADFEKEFGIKVHLDTFDDEAELLSTISSYSSRYDLFIGSDVLIGEMVELRLVAQLDLDNIPNLANIDPAFLDLPGNPGNRYGIPYDWGTTGVMYNRACIEPQEESWALLRDPRIVGRVAMDTDPVVVIGSTLKYLGYPLNSDDPDELDQAVRVLKDQIGKVQLRFIPAYDARQMMKSGELCATQAYNGDAAYEMAENEDFAFFVPKEGSDIYFDMMAMPRDAKNKAGAEIFMNYVLRPEVHAAINNYTGYATPNRAAREQGLIDQVYLSDPTVYPDTDLLEPWLVFDGSRRALWNRAWAEVQTVAPESQVSN